MVHITSTSSPLLLAFVSLALHASVQAHPGCGSPRPRGDQLTVPPSPPPPPSKRDNAATESSWAQLIGSSAECASYDYPAIDSIAANFPSAYSIASIVSTDTVAQTLFKTINASLATRLPNDSPRGTASGDFSGVNYSSSDPDCWWTYNGCSTPDASTGLVADLTTVPEANTWGYTFDDGPLCSHNEFYNYLEEQNQKATMFYIGSNVLSLPLQALRGFSDGHQICVHTWSHQYMTSLTNEQVFAELYYTQQLIKSLMGVTPLCWRPPYGDVDNRVRLIASALNMTTIGWSDDTADWTLDESSANAATQATVDSNYESFINQSKTGGFNTFGPIVLSHELSNSTMKEAMKYYPQIKATFKHVVPIATAYNLTHPYAETNVTYPDFATYISGSTMQVIANGTSDSSSVSSSSSALSSSSSSTASSSGTITSSSKSGGTTSTSATSATSSSSVSAQQAASNKTSGSTRHATNGLVLLGCLALAGLFR